MVCPPPCPQLSDLSGSLRSSQAGPCSVPWSDQEFSPPWHLCTCCPTAWTALPPCIFMASSLPSFRTFFKCYLLREVFSGRISKVATPCIILSPFSVLFCSPSHLLTHYITYLVSCSVSVSATRLQTPWGQVCVSFVPCCIFSTPNSAWHIAEWWIFVECMHKHIRVFQK